MKNGAKTGSELGSRVRQLLIVIICWAVGLAANAEQITVAVASNFTAAMNEIVTEFEQQSGHQVQVAYGSSGRFYAQIKNGAPFQVFFSADQAKPLALVDEGLAVADSRFSYATGRLALWSGQTGLVIDRGEVLRHGQFNKLALANPRLAPYGAAAVEVLENLNLINATQAKWVQGENIAQTFQFVASGNAQLGFVALAQLRQNASKSEVAEASYWVVPTNLHNPIRQDAVLLTSAVDNSAALEFLQFVASEPARKIIRSYGYDVETDPADE